MNTGHGTSPQEIAIIDTVEPAGVQGLVINNCPFTIYVRQAVAEFPSSRPTEPCAHFGETTERTIAPGETYNAPFLAAKDTCGHSLKMSRTPNAFEVYQLEYNWSLENDELWYNLSSDTAAPFDDVARAVHTQAGDCAKFSCTPGELGPGVCDYPVLAACKNKEGIVAVLC
ncbi:hypothetical protein P153DRAFT_287076 [Dothidotthia symphoricarpi CBS 119687]|uniref:Uncharacterized protein n=1 Tax=Dothidotthia symphoricarpi CBS 119687 TaxID=1392245 RepID=A0A6A6AHP7_9PLEO|nr:uncharacterized protein P153DRAFT_287076 [Dothidotthia symphoricarpi CBS 119687]KAF2131086.1 hypothetical protein P153DRAFT_287076 [Dothidotthia symphoricarpi CBS 119687]